MLPRISTPWGKAMPFILDISSFIDNNSRFLHHFRVLILHRSRRADDDREKSEERSDGKRRNAGDRLSHRAAHRQNAAKAHQRAADGVVDEILERCEPLDAKASGCNRLGRKPDKLQYVFLKHLSERAECQHARPVNNISLGQRAPGFQHAFNNASGNTSQ